MFHILVVEDDDDFVDELREIVKELPGNSEIRVACSRDEAFDVLEEGFLDLVILDLKIPTVSGALDADPEHGHAVFTRIRAVAPGTPIFVLTGSPAEDFLSDLVLKNQQQIDIWSEGQETGTILFLKKYDIDKCPDMLARVARAVECLSDVELERNGLKLSLAEDRLIRIFAKRFQGVRCVAVELSSGLSGARVIRVRVTNRQGAQVLDAVAKLSTHDDIRREGACYDSHVVRLDPAATPRKLETLEYGAHRLAGIFFGLVDGSDESAFDVAGDSPERSEIVIRSAKSATAPWVAGVRETRTRIRELRRRILNDEVLTEIRLAFELDWIEEFEDREIQVCWACSHGDLHGSNVLVSPKGVTLIDYGDVGDGPASLDPVTLELSLLFHPNSPHARSAWPSAELAKAWGDMGVYLDRCPFPQFVRECRAWAVCVAAGNREVAASAYSYLVRQLKYKDTDKERALALLDGVRSFYQAST